MKHFYHLIILIIILFFSSCFYPHYTIFYENKEFPIWTDASGIWSYDDEKWLMRGFDHSSRTGKVRDTDIIRKYYIDDALCYIGIRAKNETTHYSRNPYSISLQVFGLPNKYTSFTVKNIIINSSSGNILSDLSNKDLPTTVELQSESATVEDMLVWGYYKTEEVFNLKKEPIIIEFTIDLNGNGEVRTGKISCELEAIGKFGLIIPPD